MATKVICLLCQKQNKETILSSLDSGVIARSYQEELMAVGRLMTIHMDTVHNSTLQNEIRAIPMYNGFNVMKYFDEQIPEGKAKINTKDPETGELVAVDSEFNYQKEFMRTQLTEQIMQCAPEMEDEDIEDDIEDDDDELDEEDEEFDDEDEPNFDDATTNNEPCEECGCNPCECDDDEDDDLEDETEDE